MVGRRVPRVQFDGPTILALGSRPIMIELEMNVRQRGMRLRQRGVELQGLHECALGLRECVYWCETAVPALRDPSVGDAGPGPGIPGVQVDRLLEVVEGRSGAGGSTLVPEVPAL